MNHRVTLGMRVWCHVALEDRALGTWEAKCNSTLMHEHGSGRVKGLESTWPSNGHVSNRLEGGVLHPKEILFDGKEGKQRVKKIKKGREKKRGKKKKGKKIKDREKGKEREGRGAVQDFHF